MSQRYILLHEYVHHLVRSASSRNYPTWYNEGLAEVLAATYEEEGKVVVGATSEVRAADLANNPFATSLARIVNEDNLSELHPYVVNYFYAMSWALVNYLHTGHLAGYPERLSQMQRYLDLVAGQMDRERAFEEAFHATPRKIQREVFSYLKRSPRPVLMLPAERFAYAEPIVQKRMATSEVAVELAFQSLAKPEVAHQLLDHALQGDPDNPFLLSAKGIAFQMEGKYSEGAALARQAARAAPDDAILALDLADLLAIWYRAECGDKGTSECAARLEEARVTYRIALAAAPGNPEINYMYGRMLATEYDDPAGALTHLGVALERQPWNSEIHLHVGLANAAVKQAETARFHLERALYWTESPEIRRQASDALQSLGARQRPAS